eukprot:6200703-Pleurochrysis_carterae.AAC.2
MKGCCLFEIFFRSSLRRHQTDRLCASTRGLARANTSRLSSSAQQSTRSLHHVGEAVPALRMRQKPGKTHRWAEALGCSGAASALAAQETLRMLF